MRPLILSNCERDFILRSLLENQRLDGRSIEDFRDVVVTLGEENGSCLAVLGNTKVFAQASCAITTPKASRPSEGSLFVNVELSPMAAPQFESGRLGDLGVEVCRLLERSLKQSRCLDLESLCLISGEKVWEIRLDVHVIDYDGSIVDAASLASICALRHFKVPDVTILSGNEIRVHTVEEKEPIPLYFMHFPLCVTFGVCDQGKLLVADLTESEEQVIDGKIVMAMNSRRELCASHCSGNTLFNKEQILRCSSKAALRAKQLTDIINKVFEIEKSAAAITERGGFAKLIPADEFETAQEEEMSIQEASSLAPSSRQRQQKPTNKKAAAAADRQSPKIVRKGKISRIEGTKTRLPTEKGDDDDSDIEEVKLVEDEMEQMMVAVDEEDTTSSRSKKVVVQDDDDDDQEIMVVSSSKEAENIVSGSGKKKKKKGKAAKHQSQEVQSLLDEIEDDVQVLLPGDSGFKTASTTRPAVDDPDPPTEEIDVIDLTGALKSNLKRGKQQKRSK